MAALSLSSWAVHDWIGQSFEFNPGEQPPTGVLDRLLLLPAKACEFGIRVLEICDFHLVPDDGQMEVFRSTASEEGVHLFQLLIDNGDISHPTDSATHLAYVESWIRLAALGGFSRVRVSAGKQAPTREAIERSITGLLRLKTVADEVGVGISTENWHSLMTTPEVVSEVIDRTGVGLVFDFGNWGGDDKYARLGQIVRYATSCHAKCHYKDGEPLLHDFETCLEIAKESGFDGNLTLVHPEPPDEWAALDAQASAVRHVFGM